MEIEVLEICVMERRGMEICVMEIRGMEVRGMDVRGLEMRGFVFSIRGFMIGGIQGFGFINIGVGGFFQGFRQVLGILGVGNFGVGMQGIGI